MNEMLCISSFLRSLSLSLSLTVSPHRQALDQYTHLTEQRAELLERKKELDTGRQSIMELISHLDMKKDEAIERTFK